MFARQSDQQAARRLSRRALGEAERVAAALADRGHLGYDGQIVNDKGDLVALVLGQVLRVAEYAEAGDVGGRVRIVLVHELSSDAIQPRHRADRAQIGAFHVLLAHDQLHLAPSIGVVEPLVGVDGHLGAERLGENEHVADHGVVGHDELVGRAYGGRHAADDEPRIDDRLAAGHARARLVRAVVEAEHHARHDQVALLLAQLVAHAQQHEHVVALGHAHGIEVAEHVGARDPAHRVRVLDERIKEVGGLDEAEAGVTQRNHARVEADADRGHARCLIAQHAQDYARVAQCR